MSDDYLINPKDNKKRPRQTYQIDCFLVSKYLKKITKYNS